MWSSLLIRMEVSIHPLLREEAILGLSIEEYYVSIHPLLREEEPWQFQNRTVSIHPLLREEADMNMENNKNNKVSIYPLLREEALQRTSQDRL